VLDCDSMLLLVLLRSPHVAEQRGGRNPFAFRLDFLETTSAGHIFMQTVVCLFNPIGKSFKNQE
jgi:hypothetical protein